jgi:translation elongation factor EF-G
MNYLDLWIANLLGRKSVRLTHEVSVVGNREKHLGPRSEFAKVVMKIEPAEGFEVVDNVPYRKELEDLGVAWPLSAVFAEFGPLYKIRVTLNDAAYHEVDSSENAFREAGRDAGRNLVELANRDRLIDWR